MAKTMTIKEAAAWLKARDNFLVLAHRRPDGDAIGSAAGLVKGLRLCGKTAYMLENPEMTEKFISYTGGCAAPESFVPEHIVTTDTATEEMLQINGMEYKGKIELSIDHHVSNSKYAQNVCVYPERAACGEVACEVLNEMGAEVDAETATLLYIAVSTDCGCFAYGNTNAETFETAAELVKSGADIRGVNKLFFRTKSKNRMQFEGALLRGLEFCFDDKVAFMTVMLADRDRYHVTDNDMDDIASIPSAVEGVFAGITVKETTDGGSKISVRTSGGYNANILCSAFGGGGHAEASGCTINALPGEAKRLIKEQVAELWEL